ncbi:glycoside hydrolase family 3 N-terminal domain-containing protein [Methylacidimicrobium tartarophylax]|uniref:beta-N-acetylhexosaminidase n=1 Tax=Methylacidimicrobium tartarophylax TaxID=1041768 RepID=A0A5E6MK13_9BACT|nr:glycoside hydrolase family 3 N-terminal domain-containing protein [Methylacidimicrobium tartarophylax]VVM06397.1 beta-N-acetylhexosaminidase [Methylacidimicrobium tartarophylax]
MPHSLADGGKFLVLGIPGPEVDLATRELIEAVRPSGFILFARNLRSAEQLRALLDELRGLSSFPPFLAMDQEGGRVSRLRRIGNEPPSARDLRERGDSSLILRHGTLTGQLFRLFGLNWNLAPVLDLAVDEEADNSLRNRCYGRSPDEVSRFASAFLEGMQAEGILSCGKHFPGYTFVHVDPHQTLPTLDRTLRELEATEWKPFRELLAACDSLMVGHVRCPNLDSSGAPSSLSPAVVEGILRRKWGYSGLVVTDDLDMGAIANQYSLPEAAELALRAGNDLLLVCHRPSLAREAAERLARLPDAVRAPAERRIETLRRRLAAPLPFSFERFVDLDVQVARLRVDSLSPQRASEPTRDHAKHSPVETF